MTQLHSFQTISEVNQHLNVSLTVPLLASLGLFFWENNSLKKKGILSHSFLYLSQYGRRDEPLKTPRNSPSLLNQNLAKAMITATKESVLSLLAVNLLVQALKNKQIGACDQT